MKNYSLLILGLLCLFGCKPASQTFKYDQAIHFNFFQEISGILGDPKAIIDSVQIFRAVMEEQLVERDAVAEYKLINTRSVQPTVNFQVSKNSNHLFLMQLFTTPPQDELIIFLSTGYNAAGVCTHLGPAYLGNVRIDQIDVKRELKIKKQKGIYWLKDMAKKDMNILAFEDFPFPVETGSTIRIKQIILQEQNKIGGDKPLLFTTQRIFNDTNALTFTYLETIKK